jgi:endoglucanase Acf2
MSPEWVDTQWFKEWVELAKRDYHGRDKNLPIFDYSEMLDYLNKLRYHKDDGSKNSN